MAIAERVCLYRQIESLRQRPLVAFVTSNRQNAVGMMAGDSIAELIDQLNKIPRSQTAIDLLVISQGGDPAVAWRAMCLIRERFQEVGVLVPNGAFSAATLLCLGANEIVMHPMGNLGPVDPQISRRRNGKEDVKFGYEDVALFLDFIKERVHITDQDQLGAILSKLIDEVGAVAVGTAMRGSMLSQSMGENLLRMHMTSEAEGAKAQVIAETLNRKFYHHGHAVGRAEAKKIGLKVADAPEELESLMWGVWEDIEREARMREPFLPITEIMRLPESAQLLEPLRSFAIPNGLPQPLLAQLAQAILPQIQPVVTMPAVDSETIHAVIESQRHCSRFVCRRRILAVRQPDGNLGFQVIDVSQGWSTCPVPDAEEALRSAVLLSPTKTPVTLSSDVEVAADAKIGTEQNGATPKRNKRAKVEK